MAALGTLRLPPLLSPAQAALITKIEEGQQVTSDEIFGTAENSEGLAKMQALLNSKKYVYGDGSTFLKMSAFVLTPEFTSLWDQNLNILQDLAQFGSRNDF